MGLKFNLPWARKSADAPKPKPSSGIEGFGARFTNDPTVSRALALFVGAIENPHPTLLYQQSKRGAGYRGGMIDLLVEAYEKDPFIMGQMKSRIENVLAMDGSILQRDQTATAVRASKLIDRVQEELGGFSLLVAEALERSLIYGISVHEVIWDYREFPLPRKPVSGEEEGKSSRWLIPVGTRQVRPNRVGFDSEGRLIIRASFKGAEAAEAGYTPMPGDTNWWYPNPANILIFNRYTDFDSPYGYPLLATLFYKAWAKRMTEKIRLEYLDRYTTPTNEAVGDKDAQISDEDKLAIRNVLTNFQRHTGIRFPPGWSFKQHELTAIGAVSLFEQMVQSADDQAAYLINGQTSTSMTAAHGSQAQSQVQERNALAKYASDAVAVSNWVNQWLRFIVSVNLPDAVNKCPRLNINTKSAAEVFKWTETIEKWVDLGVPIPVREAYRVSGIDEPQGSEPVIKRPLPPVTPGAPGQKPPSQQASTKSPARAGQRDKAKAPQSQSQPRSPR